MPTIYKPKKKYPKRDSDLDKERGYIYNSERWRKLRAYKFANDPLCEKCLENGITTPADDVHHIIPFMSTNDTISRKELAYDYDNLQSLCKEHHMQAHNRK
jgi:5-methylcytosine-specific restriction protein A